MAKKNTGIIIPNGHKPLKKDLNVAWILANHFKTTVNILKPINRYKVKTPDFLINGEYYELKVLTSPQTRQLLVLLDKAKKQAYNIVIDTRKTKITTERAAEICTEFVRKHKKHKILLVTTATSVLDIKP